jgi:DNA-binding transcriptional ArsR family regulator
MQTSSDRLGEAMVGLAWSQWTELGVRGVARRDRWGPIDPEALLVLTAGLAEDDPRLRDESLDWCVKYHRYLSRSRLRNVLRRLPDGSRTAYGRYAATLSASGVRGWSAEAEPWPFEPTSKSELTDLSRPALARLRLRAIFGVSARAEILYVLAWQTSGWESSAGLAALAGYTKRNVDDELDSLERAGLVDATASGNRRLVRLRDRNGFEAFVGGVPGHFLDWVLIVGVLTDLRALLRKSEDADRRVQDVEASQLIDTLSRRPGIKTLPPPPPTVGESAWRRLEQWGLRLAEQPAAAGWR